MAVHEKKANKQNLYITQVYCNFQNHIVGPKLIATGKKILISQPAKQGFTGSV